MGTTIMEKTIATTGREVHLSKVILLFCLPILFFSCNTKDVYHTFNHIPERGWDKRVIERFSPVIEDTISTYDIDLSLRYTNDYNYRNLWLFITCEAETGEEFTDTMSMGNGSVRVGELPISRRFLIRPILISPVREGILFLFSRECVMM